VQVATVNNLLFPHARQVLRIQRKRRTPAANGGARRAVYAIPGLPAEQATAAEIDSWARGHWTVETPSTGVETSPSTRTSPTSGPATPSSPGSPARPGPRHPQTGRPRQYRLRQTHPHRPPRVLALHGLT
jgi:hypothetical protein